jgi:integration host factor subunit beta
VIKSQLVIIVAGQFRHIRQRKIEKAVDAILDQIVSDGERVELRGFGSFSVKVREGRVGRNPKTGAQSTDLKRRFLLLGRAAKSVSGSTPSPHWLNHQNMLPLVGIALRSIAGSNRETSSLPSRGFTPPRVLSQRSHRNE